MKAYKLITVGAGVLLASMFLLHKNSLASGSENESKTIDEYITARMRTDRIPGAAVAIVKNNQIVYLKGYGQADPSGRLVTPQTPFIIGSITKPMTALAVMQLVEAGKVKLDAPVQHYLPWFRVADPQVSSKITVRMLINQTSGLPQSDTIITWTWPNDAGAIQRHVRLLAKSKLLYPPGRGFDYSNANYVTLGMIVQAVSGQFYEDYIRQHIFKPLEMKHSFVSQEDAMQDGMATGYQWRFGYPIPVTIPYNRANLPAGFAISSAEDMSHFLIAQMNGGKYQNSSVLSPEGISLLQAEPSTGSYGMGWETVHIDGHKLINHDGATANYQCSLFIDPQSHVGVFIAANAMSGLDGLSSSRSLASLGASTALITTRDMAYSVLHIAANRPIPKQGPGQRRVSIIVDLVILGLTGLLLFKLIRIPARYKQGEKQELNNRSKQSRRIITIALEHFVWPLALLYTIFQVPFWIFLKLYQPEVIIWLESMATAVSLKGLLEIFLSLRSFRQQN
jgi:CubicO group peptidase (beta-lactamase class C family)